MGKLETLRAIVSALFVGVVVSACANVESADLEAQSNGVENAEAAGGFGRYGQLDIYCRWTGLRCDADEEVASASLVMSPWFLHETTFHPSMDGDWQVLIDLSYTNGSQWRDREHFWQAEPEAKYGQIAVPLHRLYSTGEPPKNLFVADITLDELCNAVQPNAGEADTFAFEGVWVDGRHTAASRTWRTCPAR